MARSWLKLDPRIGTHPAAAKAGDAALGLWLRGGAWLATFPKQDDFIPARVARSMGKPSQIKALVASGLWVEIDGGFAMRRTMNIATSGLTDSFWDVQQKGRRAHIPESLRLAVYERDGFACRTCGSMDDLTLDHIHPWSKGGDDSFDNLRTLCRSCNCKKGAQILSYNLAEMALGARQEPI